jgi:hypothetical protein
MKFGVKSVNRLDEDTFTVVWNKIYIGNDFLSLVPALNMMRETHPFTFEKDDAGNFYIFVEPTEEHREFLISLPGGKKTVEEFESSETNVKKFGWKDLHSFKYVDISPTNNHLQFEGTKWTEETPIQFVDHHRKTRWGCFADLQNSNDLQYALRHPGLRMYVAGCQDVLSASDKSVLEFSANQASTFQASSMEKVGVFLSAANGLVRLGASTKEVCDGLNKCFSTSVTEYASVPTCLRYLHESCNSITVTKRTKESCQLPLLDFLENEKDGLYVVSTKSRCITYDCEFQLVFCNTLGHPTKGVVVTPSSLKVLGFTPETVHKVFKLHWNFNSKISGVKTLSKSVKKMNKGYYLPSYCVSGVHVRVAKSSIVDEGAFAKIPMFKESVIGRFGGPRPQFVNREFYEQYDMDVEWKGKTRRVSAENHWTGKLNHVNTGDPRLNVKLQRDGTMILLRDVKVGEELFFDYGDEFWAYDLLDLDFRNQDVCTQEAITTFIRQQVSGKKRIRSIDSSPKRKAKCLTRVEEHPQKKRKTCVI